MEVGPQLSQLSTICGETVYNKTTAVKCKGDHGNGNPKDKKESHKFHWYGYFVSELMEETIAYGGSLQ